MDGGPNFIDTGFTPTQNCERDLVILKESCVDYPIATKGLAAAVCRMTIWCDFVFLFMNSKRWAAIYLSKEAGYDL